MLDPQVQQEIQQLQQQLQQLTQRLQPLQTKVDSLEGKISTLRSDVPGIVESQLSTFTLSGQTGIRISGTGRGISVGIASGAGGAQAPAGTSIWTGATVELELCDGTFVTVPSVS